MRSRIEPGERLRTIPARSHRVDMILGVVFMAVALGFCAYFLAKPDPSRDRVYGWLVLGGVFVLGALVVGTGLRALRKREEVHLHEHALVAMAHHRVAQVIPWTEVVGIDGTTYVDANYRVLGHSYWVVASDGTIIELSRGRAGVDEDLGRLLTSRTGKPITRQGTHTRPR